MEDISGGFHVMQKAKKDGERREETSKGWEGVWKEAGLNQKQPQPLRSLLMHATDPLSQSWAKI